MSVASWSLLYIMLKSYSIQCGSFFLNYTTSLVNGLEQEREGAPGRNGKDGLPAEEKQPSWALEQGMEDNKNRSQVEDIILAKVWQQNGRDLAWALEAGPEVWDSSTQQAEPRTWNPVHCSEQF